MSDDFGSALLMSSAQWFDDWRDWVEWTNSHGPADLQRLEADSAAAGRPRMPMSELILHHQQLASRATAWARMCSRYSAEFGLSPDDYERLPAARRPLYARLPDSRVWGHARGTYLRKEAIDYLEQRLCREATEPLLYRRGLTCLHCRHHHDWHSFKDIRLPDDDTGFATYCCSECGALFVYYQGREMTPREAEAAAAREVRAAAQAFDPQPWPIRLLVRLFVRS